MNKTGKTILSARYQAERYKDGLILPYMRVLTLISLFVLFGAFYLERKATPENKRGSLDNTV